MYSDYSFSIVLCSNLWIYYILLIYIVTLAPETKLNMLKKRMVTRSLSSSSQP